MSTVTQRISVRAAGIRGAAHAGIALARLSISILVALCAGPAWGDIYKCTGKTSIPTYQNFPCELDSLGSLAITSEPGTGSSIAAAKSAARTRASAGSESNAVHPAAAPSVPRVGMTGDQVTAIWGEPTETIREEFVKGDIETWTYTDSRSIRFDSKGRVQQISW